MASSRKTQPILSYRDLVRIRTQLDLGSRTSTFTGRILGERADGVDGLHFREVLSPMDREVFVRDHLGRTRTMLMFGSNNYLGLATHPRVVERVRDAAARYGAGIAGPPILNGYGPLHRELEERAAAFEHQEDALVFASGYAANVGMISALPGPKDLVVYDALSHASVLDGLKLGRIEGRPFPHNDWRALDALLAEHAPNYRDVFVAAEGVYSMSGAVGRLDRIAEVCRKHGAALVVDDAHGTGVTGPNGRGTVAMFDVADAVEAVVGTFSKALAVSGGFVAGSRDVVEYLRYFSRSYVFSTSPSPVACAAALAGLDVIETEPELHGRLVENAAYLAERLREIGIEADGMSAVFPLPVPARTDVRAAAHAFHERGLFLSHVEAPAVRVSEQRFRVTVTAPHTRADLDRLVEAVDAVWAEHVRPLGDGAAGGAPTVAPQPGYSGEAPLDVYEGGF